VVTGNLDASGNQAAVLGAESVFQTFTRQQRVAGSINAFPLTGLPIGGVFRAAMRQSTNPADSSLDATWDSYLRVRNSANTSTLASDDDNGPGALSAMTGSITVPTNGEALVQVTGYDDRNTFTGADSANTGYYDLDVLQRAVMTPAAYGVNVQWWKFANLTPGAAFSAQTIAATLTQGTGVGSNDTILAAFDSSAALLGSDDDSAGNSLSLLNGVVPLDGIVYIAVTAYQGSTFSPSSASTYNNANNNGSTGSFQLQFVPAPSSVALLGLGGLVGARRRRR
jgi:hypothetical protein